MIKISEKIYGQLTDYCRNQLPNEACGALLGHVENEQLFITSFQPFTNFATEPVRHFEFEPTQFTEFLYSAESNNWIGIFHSHPTTPAYPSSSDLEVLWEKPIYAILSLMPGTPSTLRAFSLRSTKKKPYSITEQTVEIIVDPIKPGG